MAQLRSPNVLLLALRSLKGAEGLVSSRTPFAVPRAFISMAQVRYTWNPNMGLMGMDRYTKRKSEYRIPGMSDDRVRERHILIIPATICTGLLIWLFYLFSIIAEK